MLPTCPACKQSVLDDDATECPFCGANMKTGKGGGSAKPLTPKPVAPAGKSSATPPPVSKAATSKPASKPAASRKSSLDDDDDDPFSAGEDDDPFAAATKQDAANRAKAIAVSPKKTKTHVEELKCPMCDTVGFVPENVGGKDVKCSNPKCPVPVFMAPKKFGAPAPIVAPPKLKNTAPSKKPLIFAIVGGVVFVAAVGLAVLFWPEPPPPPPPIWPPGGGPPIVVGPGDPPVDPNKPKKPEPEVVKPVVPALDVAHVLELMTDYSSEESQVNKKYARQRTAIGYATVNDPAKLRALLQRHDELEPQLPHFKIPALLTLGWQQLSAGDKAGAAKTADEALADTAKIGKGSRDTQEAMIDLAAFLVATVKLDAAKKLLAEHFVQDASTPLVVNLAFARHRRDFDFDPETPGKTSNPQCDWGDVGVTLVLAGEGLWNEAQLWAEGNPDVEARTDCLLAWADARLRDALAKQQPADPAVEGIAAKLTPGGKVQLLSRLALTQTASGKTADADRLVAAARETLKTISVPPAARFEGFKAALDWKAPEAAPLRQAVLGAATLGQAQAGLKKLDEAWNSTIEALKYARAIAPSPAAVAGMKSDVDRLGGQGLQDKLRMELKLNNRDEAIRKGRELKNKLDSTEQLGLARYRLQDAVLKSAVEAGLGDQVWRETLSLSQRSDPHELEPYLSGTLPLYLIQQFNKDGLQKEAAEVTTKIEGTELPADQVMELKHLIAESLANQKLNEVVAAFSQHRLVGPAEEFALKTFARAAKQPGQALPTLAAVTSMDVKSNNQFVKLEALRMLAAYASRQGDFIKVRDAIQNQKQAPLEKVSAFLGLLEGYTAWQRAQPPPPKTEEDKPKAAQAAK
ncbi:MAG: hypothetical protein JWN70_5785 [Planctomycetaceae bacterium]|nr:hypothetical protein [Planctomycetaceae bacterium]